MSHLASEKSRIEPVRSSEAASLELQQSELVRFRQVPSGVTARSELCRPTINVIVQCEWALSTERMRSVTAKSRLEHDRVDRLRLEARLSRWLLRRPCLASRSWTMPITISSQPRSQDTHLKRTMSRLRLKNSKSKVSKSRGS